MSLWKNSDFVKLWTGQTISEMGSRISREGLPMTAVLMLGATPGQMGLLAATAGLAALVAAPVAGHMADRGRHRPVLIASDIGRAALLACIPVAASTGHLSMALLLSVAFAAGILTVVFDVHYQSFLPRLVKREDLLEGNQKLALTVSTAEVLGPGITGVLVQALTAPIAILFDAVSFLVSAVSVGMIRSEANPTVGEHHEAGLKDALAGFQFVKTNPILRALILRTATLTFAGSFFGSLYVIYAVRELGLSPAVLGAVIMVGGVSNLVGALLADRVGKRWKPGTILVGASLLGGLGTMFIPLARGPWLLALSQLAGDFTFTLYAIFEITVRQHLTPPHLMGRVNACAQLAAKGMFPIGALAGGLLADRIGIRAVLFLGVAGVIASSGWLIFSPVRKLQGFDTASAASVH